MVINKGPLFSNFKYFHKMSIMLGYIVPLEKKLFGRRKQTKLSIYEKSAKCGYVVHFYSPLKHVVLLWVHFVWLHTCIQGM